MGGRRGSMSPAAGMSSIGAGRRQRLAPVGSTQAESSKFRWQLEYPNREVFIGSQVLQPTSHSMGQVEMGVGRRERSR